MWAKIEDPPAAHQTDVGHDLNHPVLGYPILPHVFLSSPSSRWNSSSFLRFSSGGGVSGVDPNLRCTLSPSWHGEFPKPKAARHTIGTTCLSQTPLSLYQNTRNAKEHFLRAALQRMPSILPTPAAVMASRKPIPASPSPRNLGEKIHRFLCRCVELHHLSQLRLKPGDPLVDLC